MVLKVEAVTTVVSSNQNLITVVSKSGLLANQKCIFLKFKINPNGLNLPPRYKEHLDFFTQNADNINCKICQINFSNNSIAMKQHVLNSHHRQTAGLALQKYNYFCEICNVFIKDEAAWDYHFIKGPNRYLLCLKSINKLDKISDYFF